MKSLIIFTIFIVGAFATDDDCIAEVTRIRDAIVAHVNDNTFDYINIHHKLKKLHDKEITEEEFGSFVDEFCPKALDGTKFSLDQIPKISEGCVNFPIIVSKKNLVYYFNVIFGKLCTESGKGYKDVVKNKGTSCFFGNNEYKECFKTHNTPFFAEDNFKAENVCNFVKVHVDCENLLDKCENHDVKTYQHEINNKLKEQLGCTF